MTTTKENPFHLPEIILHLGPFLTRPSLASALTVSRTWNSLLRPFLWLDTTLPSLWNFQRRPHAWPSHDAVHRNSHLIRVLTSGESPLLTALELEKTLLWEVHLSVLSPLLISIIHHNAHSLRVLTRMASVHQADRDVAQDLLLFQAVAGLTRLEQLRIERLQLQDVETDFFFKTCERIKSLHLSFCIWAEPQVFENDFLNLRSLTFIKNKMLPQQEIALIGQCPQLEELRWQTRGLLRPGAPFEVEPWTRLGHLQTLDITLAAIEDGDIAIIVSALPELIRLRASSSRFGPASAQGIVQFKPHLQELVIADCSEVSSELTQLLLMSLPELVHFVGYQFDIADLAQPWSCLGLETLRLSITSSASEQDKLLAHRRIYGQLSQLRNLKDLRLGETTMLAYTSFDNLELSLEYGLDQLANLTHLSTFSMGRMQQSLGPEEESWIATHWPRVRIV